MDRRAAWMALVALIALAAPFLIYPVFLMKGLCYALFAVSFNLILGYAGLLSFGHAAFFGMAGYVFAHMSKVWGLPPELDLLGGTAAAAALGAVFGALAIRRQGIYFAMVTLALAQMVYFFCLETPFTHGEDGIQAVPRGTLFGLIPLGNLIVLYFVVLAISALGIFLVWRTIHSPFGQVLKAIRENEPRSTSLGYRTDLFKFAAFLLSATLSGLAGALNVLVFQLASLEGVDWHTSGAVVLMTLMGGMGTPLGPVLGAFLVVAIEDGLAQLGAWVTMIEGLIFVAVVLLFRRGIAGEAAALLARWRRRAANA